MKIYEKNNNIVVKELNSFNAKHVFECGQCFRWYPNEDGSFTGIAKSHAADISFYDNTLTISNCSLKEFNDFWYEYLDLETDYEKIKKAVSKDDIMKEAVLFGEGIRLLRQDFHEALFSFILSSNNRIPMIMKAVNNISQKYGNVVKLKDKEMYSFPEYKKFLNLDEDTLRKCGGGFRCKYIINTANMLESGKYTTDAIKKLSAADARKLLTELSGVGDKVADCTLLFSGCKFDIFPTDVWVKRVMENLYFKRPATFKEIQEFALNYFGDYAGYAQQYLFYYARENSIGC